MNKPNAHSRRVSGDVVYKMTVRQDLNQGLGRGSDEGDDSFFKPLS